MEHILIILFLFKYLHAFLCFYTTFKEVYTGRLVWTTFFHNIENSVLTILFCERNPQKHQFIRGCPSQCGHHPGCTLHFQAFTAASVGAQNVIQLWLAPPHSTLSPGVCSRGSSADFLSPFNVSHPTPDHSWICLAFFRQAAAQPPDHTSCPPRLPPRFFV